MCFPSCDRAREADVDEIACLIDFGVPIEATLRGLATSTMLCTVANRTAEFGDLTGYVEINAFGRQCSQRWRRMLSVEIVF